MPTESERMAAKFGDRLWRLNNLYWIIDKRGKRVLFRMNDVQRRLYDRLHYLNVILKSRQTGMSTFIQLLMLDLCLFNSNQQGGVIAHTLEDAKAIFDNKIKYAYDNLPDWLRTARPAASDRAGELGFANGSRIRVATSLRSGTMQMVHVSEYGKICRKYPDKAKEVRTGTLQTVAPGQFVFIESTAEGRFGDFYDMVQKARRRAHEPRPLSAMEYRLHFFAWFDDPTCRIGGNIPVPVAVNEYCDSIEAKAGVKIDREQRAWYALKSLELGEAMKQEYPSLPDEAFEQAVEGAYYTKQMTRLRKQGQLRPIPLSLSTPVHSFWDLGYDDYNALWLMQTVAGQPRFLSTFQNSGEGLSYYINWLQQQPGIRGKLFVPHDAEQKRLTDQGAKCAVDYLVDLGVRANDIIVVPRVARIIDGIEACRRVLPECWIDPEGCADGVVALDSYRKEWNDRLGVWKDEPLHDEHSHLADAYRQYAQARESGLLSSVLAGGSLSSGGRVV